MNHDRSFSSPELIPDWVNLDQSDDSSLQGVATNVKLLLKIIQDHNSASKEDDGRKMQRFAGMISILEDVKARIQKSQFVRKKREAELRRCNTDVRHVPRDKRPHEQVLDEKQRLQKELNDCLAARKSLERMFSCLGKEKEIISAELARKVQELNAVEEQLSDLKSQNAMLMAKAQNYAAKYKEKTNVGCETQGNTTLQDRNKALSEQLLRSLDGYRSIKRKMKEVQEENAGFHTKMVEIVQEIESGLDRIQTFRDCIGKLNELTQMEEHLSTLEDILHSVEEKVSCYGAKTNNCTKSTTKHKVEKP